MGRRTKLRRFAAAAGLVLLAGGAAGFVAGRDHVLPERSPAHRGFEAAVAGGCFGCHGVGDEGAAQNPPEGARVPALLAGASSAATIRRWIEDGSREPGPALIRMPAYRGRLAPEEIDDLVAWLSLERYARARPSALPTGEALARRLGCFGCHGPLGQGGVENPRSLKGYVPGFFGKDFDLLTDGGDRAQVREWIRDGAPRAFLDQEFLGVRPARWFFARQAIVMPAYGAILSEAELEALVDYVLDLRRRGPLDTAGLESYRRSAAVAAPGDR